MSIFKFAHQRIQSAILTLVGLSLLLCNTWVPLPITVVKDLSIPFPCQAKGCGCQNANQCWSNCCCHSDSEKLAWAAKHGVEPPSWFIAKQQTSASNHEDCEPESLSGPKPKSDAGGGCCCCCQKKSAKQPAVPKKSGAQLLILKQQMNCNGLRETDGFQRLEIQLYAGAQQSTPPSTDVAPLYAMYHLRLPTVTVDRAPRPD